MKSNIPMLVIVLRPDADERSGYTHFVQFDWDTESILPGQQFNLHLPGYKFCSPWYNRALSELYEHFTPSLNEATNDELGHIYTALERAIADGCQRRQSRRPYVFPKQCAIHEILMGNRHRTKAWGAILDAAYQFGFTHPYPTRS